MRAFSLAGRRKGRLSRKHRSKAGRRWGPAANRVGGQACRCRRGTGFLGRAREEAAAKPPTEPHCCWRGGEKAVSGLWIWVAGHGGQNVPVRCRLHRPMSLGLRDQTPLCRCPRQRDRTASERGFIGGHTGSPGMESSLVPRTMFHCGDAARWLGPGSPERRAQKQQRLSAAHAAPVPTAQR